jgi:PAS domain S-box-containing protein
MGPTGVGESAQIAGGSGVVGANGYPADAAPASGRSLVWLGVLIGVAFYAADAAVHAFIQGRGSFVGQLFQPDIGALLLRLGVLALALALGVYADRRLRREGFRAQQVRTTERFLSSIIDNIPDMVFIKDAEALRFVRVNRAGERLLGFAERDLIGKSDYDFFPCAQADFFTRNDREVLESGAQLDIPEEEIDTRSMGKRVLHTKKVPVGGDDGQPAYLLGIAEDITERREAERRIQSERARAEHYLLISRALIVGLDLEGRVTLINPRGCEILGYAESELLGRSWFNTVVPEDKRSSEIEAFHEVAGSSREPACPHESEILTKNGEVRYVAWNVSAEKGHRGEVTGILCSGQDVTDRVQAQIDAQRHHRELAHAMRLGTMGEMASGMAHEINQPLTAVTAYLWTAIAFLEKNPPVPEKAVDAIRRGVDQVHRAGSIIQRLRELVRKGVSTREPVELDPIIRSVAGFVDWELRNNGVCLDLELHAEGRPVQADRVQIEQVLINLILNAIESVASAGVSSRRVVVRSAPMDGTVAVTVEDNGPGIDGSIRRRLFEPFQTTKEQGLGVGLSISSSIIDAHEGRMWGENGPDGGAIFGFELPVARV